MNQKIEIIIRNLSSYLSRCTRVISFKGLFGRAVLPQIGDITRASIEFFVASDETGILGVLTLVIFPIPTGIRAWIEDVIVDDAARGKGVGRLINEAAVAYAFEHGAITVDLTSRPSREAANRLYQRIGFVQRDTNVYRYAKPEQLDS